MAASSEAERSLSFAYADPPYLGCGQKLYGKHHPDAKLWDSKQAHIDLLARLDRDFDGWAYSCLPRDLEWVLPAAPGARIAAWVKPMCAWKPWQRIGQAWEPVVYRTPRTTVKTGEQHLRMRDYLTCSATIKRGLPGAKPDAFARWVLLLLGWKDGDELSDLFPGTGVVTAALDQMVLS